MRQFLISAAAAAAFVGLSASAPALADMHYGPTQVGNQCFKWTGNNARDATFGYWDTCPKPASIAAAPAVRRARHR